MRYSTNELSREFARLKQLYTECSRENRPGKRRFAFYEYLYEVYALHSRWRAAIGRRIFRAQVADLASRPMKPDQRVLKLIIDTSCTADQKTRSRWGQALRYVWRRRKRQTVSREEFDAFLHCNGGVVGCAAKSAMPKMKPDRIGDWGSVLIRSLFKRALIRRNPMRCRKARSMARPLVTCELPGRCEHFIKGKTIRKSCGT